MLVRMFPTCAWVVALAFSPGEARLPLSADEKVQEEPPEEPKQVDEPVKYGVDVSFPIQHAVASDNYAWLPHNLDPNILIPNRYEDMAIQQLGDRETFYQDYINGCLEKFSKDGNRCIERELIRVATNLGQPQNIQVRSMVP
jgi:hypothetical protein